MLLILAEANAFKTSGAYNEFPKWAAAGCPSLCGLLVLKALATSTIKSIALRIF